MVEESEDAGVVTERIEREMREARAAARARAEAVAGLRAEVASSGAEEPVAALRVETPPAPPPVSAETAYRHGRLGVVAVLVLVLFWAWVRERRRGRQETRV